MMYEHEHASEIKCSLFALEKVSACPTSNILNNSSFIVHRPSLVRSSALIEAGRTVSPEAAAASVSSCVSEHLHTQRGPVGLFSARDLHFWCVPLRSAE